MLSYIDEKDKQFGQIPYKPFIDYKTGEYYPKDGSLDTQYYWKPLSRLLEDYIDHPESKSDDNVILEYKESISKLMNRQYII